MKSLGKKIKSSRLEKKLTQAELAGDIITAKQLSMIENGITNPTIYTLECLADKLEKPIYYFLSDEQFTTKACQELISQCEMHMRNRDYQAIINKVERFVAAAANVEDAGYKGLLGRLYAQLGKAYYETKNEKAEEILRTALKYLDKSQSSGFYAICMNCLAAITYNHNEFARMEEYLLEANSVLAEITIDNVILKLDILYNLMLASMRQKKYWQNEALINEFLSYSKKYEVYRNYGQMNMLMSMSSMHLKNYDEAIRYSRKAIEYFVMTEDEHNKYICYSNLGIFYRLKCSYQLALEYLDMALVYFKENNNIKMVQNTKIEMIKTWFYTPYDLNIMALGIEDIFQNYAISQKDRIDLLTIKGMIYVKSNEIDNAFRQLKEAERMTEEFGGGTEFKLFVYLGLSMVYDKYGNVEMSYGYLSKVHALRC